MEIEKLLAISVEQKASDLHLTPGLKPIFRLNGTLTEIKDSEVLTAENIKHLLYSLMSSEQVSELEKKLVLEIGFRIANIGNFRASIFHQAHGMGAVFRIVPSRIPTLAELGLPGVVKNLLALSHGLILVTGATGSGKSTTLAAMIDHINTTQSSHIITIEDPIEFVHTNKKSIFSQLQVGRDTESFYSALRSALRQDADVILLGELRDIETMRLALAAAETGHLVLATLHSSTAPLAINRFVDVFPSKETKLVRNLLAETLQAVVCQTLVKASHGGRVAALEVLLATPAIRHYIHKNMPSHMESTMQTNRDKGMCTFEQSLRELVEKHRISQATVDVVMQKRGLDDNSKKAHKHGTPRSID